MVVVLTVVVDVAVVVDVVVVVDSTVVGGSATVAVVDDASVRVTGWAEVVALIDPLPPHAAGATKTSIQIAMLGDRVIAPLLRRRAR